MKWLVAILILSMVLIAGCTQQTTQQRTTKFSINIQTFNLYWWPENEITNYPTENWTMICNYCNEYNQCESAQFKADIILDMPSETKSTACNFIYKGEDSPPPGNHWEMEKENLGYQMPFNVNLKEDSNITLCCGCCDCKTATLSAKCT